MPQLLRRSLAEEIRVTLRERILRGELRPGERVIEQVVAREMGTSQGPVREALAFLSQEGLLISLPHRGTFVSTVSEAEARMAYAIRERIEPYAVEIALPKVDAAVFEELHRDLEAMRAAARARDVGAFSAADMSFHGRFYRLAGTDVLQGLWAGVSATIRQFVAVAAPQYVKNPHEAAEHHVVMLDLVRAGDPDVLRREVIDHLNNIWKRMRSATDDDASGGGPA